MMSPIFLCSLQLCVVAAALRPSTSAWLRACVRACVCVCVCVRACVWMMRLIIICEYLGNRFDKLIPYKVIQDDAVPVEC